MSLTEKLRRFEDASARTLGRMLDHLAPASAAGSVAILAFHRVGDFPGEPTWNVGSRQFDHILRGLLERGLIPWTLDKLLQRGVTGQRQGFIVTFDDGYSSVFTKAFPILQRLEIPATVFLATGSVDTDQPFACDDWQRRGTKAVPAEAWLPLTSGHCKMMLDSGLIRFGSHTHSHQDFRGRPEALATDLGLSRRWIQDTLGIESIPFAFPYGISHMGFCADELVEVVREAEMTCALKVDPTLVLPGSDPFAMGRFMVHSDDNSTSVYHRLNSWYTHTKAKLRNWTLPIRPPAVEPPPGDGEHDQPECTPGEHQQLATSKPE